MSKKDRNHYITVMAEISHRVGVAKKAGEKTVEYDLTTLYDEIVTDTFEHERQVNKFDDVVETVTHDLRSLGFEVSEEDCCLTIKLKS